MLVVIPDNRANRIEKRDWVSRPLWMHTRQRLMASLSVVPAGSLQKNLIMGFDSPWRFAEIV